MLTDIWPSLRPNLPLTTLGTFPTRIEARPDLVRAAGVHAPPLFVKRDDLTSPIYGGNKVRTLEVLFGEALASGAREIISTGAYGSNHAVATILHAPRVGLEPGAMLFPQPRSAAAAENLAVVLCRSRRRVNLPHWSALPAAMWWMRRTRGPRTVVMPPGGAGPHGALGYVGAALELSQQVAEGALLRPKTIVLAVGSTCTTAGLLAGFVLAARLGLGLVDSAGRPAPPTIVAIRVTPWPVTSPYRVVSLALRTSRHLAQLAGDSSLELAARDLRGLLRIDGRFLGRGYGYPTVDGVQAMRLFRAQGGPELDTTYSAKSAAGLLEYLRTAEGPVVYWATKSTAALPPTEVPPTPRSMIRWLDRAPISVAGLEGLEADRGGGGRA